MYFPCDEKQDFLSDKMLYEYHYIHHHVRTACFSTGQATVNHATQKQDCLLEVEVNTSELN